MKFHTAITLVAIAIVATLLSGTSATNSTWGWVGPRDHLLYRGPVIKKSEFLRVVTFDFKYPIYNNSYNPYTISAIKAIDQDRKDGGYAMLTKGGPGSRNVTLHIKSQRNHGFNFIIEVWSALAQF